MPSARRLRIGFLHPDLGLGGAERLIVDAAHGLAQKGHSVSVFTSHYDPERSFAETRSGSFSVRVAGDFCPRSLCGAFMIVFAVLRSIWLALYVCATSYLSCQPYDVFIVDQVSVCIFVLRCLRPFTPILFYLHFPDQLLSIRKSCLKSLYRYPFDVLEELSTSCSSRVVVNSGFTRKVYLDTFRCCRHEAPQIVYPCIEVKGPDENRFAPPFLASSAGAAASGKAGRGGGASSPAGSTVFLSINRYERKKGIGLAIKAFADMLAASSSSASASAASGAAPPPHLVIAGGYDTRMAENVEHYDELVAVARAAGLITPERPLVAGAPPAALLPGFPAAGGEAKGAYAPVEGNAHVTFLRSFSDAQKAYLLRAASAVLYTPENEHFGIVPLEAMAAFRPVVAVASGGPLESVEDGVTGFLCEPTTTAFSSAMARIVADPGLVERMGRAGNARVSARFSRQAFATVMNNICLELVGAAPEKVAGDGANVEPASIKAPTAAGKKKKA